MATKILTLFVVNQALQAIMADEMPGVPTGGPSYEGRDIEAIEVGMVPRRVIWSADRGNWMWDGALHVLRAMYIDPDAPL